MKIVLLILASLVCLDFGSDYTEKELLGTWENIEYNIEEGVLGYSITFNPDYSFRQITFLDSSYDQDSIIYDGAYLLRKDSLFLSFPHPWGNEAYLITELTNKSLRFFRSIDEKEISYRLTKRN